MSFVDVILLATDANLFSCHLSVPYFAGGPLGIEGARRGLSSQAIYHQSSGFSVEDSRPATISHGLSGFETETPSRVPHQMTLQNADKCISGWSDSANPSGLICLYQLSAPRQLFHFFVGDPPFQCGSNCSSSTTNLFATALLIEFRGLNLINVINLAFTIKFTQNIFAPSVLPNLAALCDTLPVD